MNNRQRGNLAGRHLCTCSRQALVVLFSKAEQGKVSHLRDLDLGSQHSSLRLLKLLYQRMRMDMQRHRLLSAQARSVKRVLQSDIPLTSLEQPLAPEERDISKPCPCLYRTLNSQYEWMPLQDSGVQGPLGGVPIVLNHPLFVQLKLWFPERQNFHSASAALEVMASLMPVLPIQQVC